MMGLHGRGARAVLVALALGAPAVVAAVVQSESRVVVERTDLKWSSTGRTLGWLAPGAPIERIGGRDGWTRARVRGWVRGEHLVPAGDALAIGRTEAGLAGPPPGRATLGALARGVEVRRIATEGEWYEIELIGWLPDGASRPPTPAPATASTGAPPPRTEPTPTRPAATPAGDAGAVSRLAARSGLRGVPEGPVLADLPAGMVVRAGETRGGWTRVVVEGWVPRGAIEAGEDGDLSPDAVALAGPATFAGRPVTWTLEHVAVQEADEWRTDFRPGETFELARVPGTAGRYVYLALPQGMAPAFRELAPFERIRVSGTIRTGRSELTGNPIVDVTRVHP